MTYRVIAVGLFCIVGLARPQASQVPRTPEHIPLRRASQFADGPGGVNTSLPRLPYLPWDQRWWTRMFDGGFKYVRIGQYEDTSDMTGWDWVEHVKGQFRLRPEVDDYINSLVDNGATVELQLLYGNPIYTSPAGKLPKAITPTSSSVHNRDLGLYSIFWPPKSPEQIVSFIRYATWMVNHFRGRVTYYSLWNEEDGSYWNLNASPEEYGTLLAAFVKAVHETDPAAKIVFGGQATLSSEFARRTLDSCRCSDQIDVFAYHNYPGGYLSNAPPETFDAGVESTIALRRAVSSHTGVRSNIQFWMDEYNSMPSLSPEMNEAIQAKYVPRTLVYNWAQRVPTFIWELINDTSTSEGDNFGIIHGMMFSQDDFKPRPVFYTSARVNALLGNTRPDPNISFELVDREALASQSTVPFFKYGFRSSSGNAIVAYWLGAKVHPKHPLEPIYVAVRLNNTGIKHPVLIDIDADRITPLEWDGSSPGTLQRVPVRDSVMAIADAAYFDWPALPEVPSGLSATANAHSVTLRWAKQTGDLQGFIVERRLRSSGAWSGVARLSSADNIYVDAKAGGALVLSYRVRAYNSAGESGYSNVATVRSSTDTSATEPQQ